jgi:Flp pilus assembly pilin Flp
MRARLLHLLQALTRGTTGEHPGQSMVEYALLLLLTTLACVAMVALLGQTTIDVLWNPIDEFINGALGGG